jgi:prepilin-type N-terminal cleavage/methylation domain-containing protein
MLARARNQDGLTLPEVLVTMTIGLALSLAAFSIVDVTMRRSGEISARIDAVQRGRSAMDTITRQLRSQVCLRNAAVVGPAGNPRSIEAATKNSVTFYADMRDVSVRADAPAPPPGTIAGPERRTLTFGDDGTLTETRQRPSRFENGRWFYETPESSREIITHVEQYGATPYLQFFGYDLTANPPAPTDPLDGPALTAAQLQSVAKIRIVYRAQPTQKRHDNRASTVFDNEVFVRTVDANAHTSELMNPCL